MANKELHHKAKIQHFDGITNKKTRLFVVMSGIFIMQTIVAELVGVKLFSLEKIFGFEPLKIIFLGETLDLTLTVGVLPWPFIFILTDLLNEYFGIKSVKFLTYLTVVLVALSFFIYFIAILLPPTQFWITSQTKQGVVDMQAAYKSVLGQSMSIIYASLIAFVIGQLLDAYIFQMIKEKTGHAKIYLRATGSTLVSQLVDTIVVNFIYLYFSLEISFSKVLGIITLNYIYKFAIAFLSTPVLVIIHNLIDNYLSEEK